MEYTDRPIKTGIAYKLFVLKDGKLYPPMVPNPNDEATPMNVWIRAVAGQEAERSKTGRRRVQAGGKGTSTSKKTLSFRPGWHLGDIPYAPQFARSSTHSSIKDKFPADFVWAECEYSATVNYQHDAMSYGYTNSGKFRHAYAGLPFVPVEGFYVYRTNPNPETLPWIICGSIKVNRILTDKETDEICRAHGIEPMERLGGRMDECPVVC